MEKTAEGRILDEMGLKKICTLGFYFVLHTGLKHKNKQILFVDRQGNRGN